MARRRHLFASLVIGAVAVVGLVATPTVNAELENGIFTSKAQALRIVVPRGWRATEQPSYPGLVLWMLRNQPDGTIVLSAEPFTRKSYCSWPIECRNGADPLPSKLACAMRAKLGPRIKISAPNAGPKENTQAGMPSVWFDAEDGKRFIRQAVAIGADRVISLTLSAGSAEARASHVRSFEQALRTLRPLTAEELGLPAPTPEQVVLQMVDPDAGVTPTDAAIIASDGAVTSTATFESAPMTKIEPVGSCADYRN